MERKVVVANLEQQEQENLDSKPEELDEQEVLGDAEVTKEEEVVVTSDAKEVVESAEEAEETIPKEEALEEEAETIEIEDTIEVAVTPEDKESPQVEENEEVDSVTYYSNLVEKAEEFVNQNDWAFVSNELANIALHIQDGPEPSSEGAKASIQKFTEIRNEFEEKKKAHYEELNKKKAENLEAKKDLLKKFTAIITEEQWSATKEVSQIRGRFESIKLLPHNEVEALNERFESLMAEFESHKVDRLVKKLQKEEENFTLKLLLIEKMDALSTKVTDEKADFEELNKEFNDLLLQWRKVGRVPAEKNQQIWDLFNKSQDSFSELRFKHDKQYRKKVEKALEKKKKLIKEAEALLDEEDIAIAARNVNKLHNAWKKTSNLPQKEENELWDLFKAATDAFNDKKTENLDVLRDQEQENLEAKLKLIASAKELQESENLDEGHKAMQELMNQWKGIGPVPRKKSSKIWNQFKGAMDVFYEKRRDHFKDVRKDQKDNLTKKNELIAKLKELSEHDDPALAVGEAKKIQNQFKEIGHVPLKFKNKVWKQYREVCDLVYERYRSSGADLGMERKLASEGVDPSDRKEIIKYQKELEGIKKELSKLESEVIQYQEATTYFKPTNKGNKLIDELNTKIEKGEKQILEKKERISQINRSIRDIKNNEE